MVHPTLKLGLDSDGHFAFDLEILVGTVASLM
jgi:hypothetical protein